MRVRFSVGNIMGANIYNLLFVMGIGTFIRTIPIASPQEVAAVPIFALLVLPLFIGRRVATRLWASGLLILYGLYIGSMFGLVRLG